MKKTLALLLTALLILFALVGCKTETGDDPDTSSPDTTNAPSVTTGPGAEDSTAAPETKDPAEITTNAPDVPEEPKGVVEIGTAEQLLAFMNNPDLEGQYVLTADIVLNDTANVADWATTAPAVIWKPVGNEAGPFCGSFDGQGHSVTGLYVSVERGAGFFGCIDSATVKNLIIGEGYIRATGTAAGGISGFYNGITEVSDCLNLATVTAADYVGGILGRYFISSACDITVLRCVNRGKIDGTISTTAAGYVGGIVGICVGMRIDSCANFGNISMGVGLATGAIVGGIAGLMGSSQGFSETIINCYNVGIITSTQSSGGNAATAGIVGRMNPSGGEVANCYNIGDIYVGGTNLAMTAYVAAENKDHLDYTKNLYNSAKMIVTATGDEVAPSFTEKGLVGTVATGTGAAAKMNLDSSVWIDTASGAPILKDVDPSWQVMP